MLKRARQAIVALIWAAPLAAIVLAPPTDAGLVFLASGALAWPAVGAVLIWLDWHVARLEAERRVASERMMRLARKASFVDAARGLAHDINNHLTNIQIASEFLKDMALAGAAADTERVQQLHAKLISNVRQIVKTTRAFTTVGRVDLDEPARQISVQQLLEDATTLCMGRQKRENIELKVGDIDPEYMVECQPGLMTVALFNLLLNACDAVADQPVKRVSLDVAYESGVYRFEVRDTGKGFATESFGRFMLSPAERTRFDPAVPLGLAVVAAFFDKHGGTVTAERLSEGGSLVRAVLPAFQQRETPTRERAIGSDGARRAA